MKPILRVFYLLVNLLPLTVVSQCPSLDLGADTLVCTGTSVTLDAGNPGATYLWSDGTTNRQFQTFFEGEYWVELTLNGCTVKDTIYVQHGPLAYAEFYYLQTTTCSPLQVSFSQFSQTCNGSVTSWHWDFGDGTTSSQPDPDHGFAAGGDYPVSLTITTSSGSSYTTQQVVNVSGGISPSLDLGADFAICQGDQVTLNAGNPGSTYLWSTGAAGSSIDVSATGTYHVSVTKNGCTVKDTVRVTVTPLLWNDFAFTKIADCSPVKYQFNDKSNRCNGSIVNWYWEFGDGTTSTQKDPVHDFTASGSYNVRLTITDNDGNTSRRTKRVSVAVVSFSVNLGNDTTICSGNSVSLDATQSGATYLWNTGATTSSLHVSHAGNYSVAVTKNGCTMNDTIHVTTAPSVLSEWSYTVGAACLPVQVNFFDSSKAFCTQQLSAWQWDFGDGQTSSVQNPLHAYSDTGTYVVTLTTSVGNGSYHSKSYNVHIDNTPYSLDVTSRMIVCKEDSFQLDAGVPGAVYNWTPAASFDHPSSQNPRAKATANAWYKIEATRCGITLSDSIYVIIDSARKPTIIQEANLLKVNNANGYRWYFDGRELPNSNGNSWRVDKNGFYAVEVFNQNGCSARSDDTFFMPVPRNDAGDDIVIRCSPNPTRGQFQILLSEIHAQPLKLSVYDRYGRIIYTTFLTQHVTPVNIPRLARGMYFAETTINKKKRVVPVLVQ